MDHHQDTRRHVDVAVSAWSTPRSPAPFKHARMVMRFAGAEAEERRARERHRAVRTAVPGGAVSERQPQYMNIMIIFSGGVASL
eukprot:scaffold62556_cov69-Phaeocystis_antarctica.AAC.10